MSLAVFNILTLAAGATLIAFGTHLLGWHMSGMLPQLIMYGALALGGFVVLLALVGCIGAVGSSRGALLVYLLLLLPCLLGAAVIAGLSVVGEDTAVATLTQLGSEERAPLAAIGNGTTPSLESDAREVALKELYSGWEGLYLDCAPASMPTAADYAAGASVACSSNDSWAAEFGTWATDECVEMSSCAEEGDSCSHELTIANCSIAVSALANTSGTDGDGALWLFCACANAVAAELPTYTQGAKVTTITLCGLLVLLLLITCATLREVSMRAKRKAAERDKHGKLKSPPKQQELLWRGLQLSDRDQPDWVLDQLELIKEIKKRIVDAGLQVRLLKLIPSPDAAVEQADESEFKSGHMVALLAIGEGRANDARKRLQLEAQYLGMRLPTKPAWHKLGPNRILRTEFRYEHRDRFPEFCSAIRQKLILSVLEAPVKRSSAPDGAGRGAGLDLEDLLGSKKVQDVFLMHDDDEADGLLTTWTKSCRIGCPWGVLKPAQLRQLQDYLGTELSFYFAWASFYTRYLWPVAILGLFIYIARLQLEDVIRDQMLAANASAVAIVEEHEFGSSVIVGYAEDGSGDAPANATNATGSKASQEEVAHAVLTGLYALFMSVWATVFIERWKRRSKILSLDWDIVGQGQNTTARLPLHPSFQEDDVKPGFYTDRGDWVPLDEKHIKEEEQELFKEATDSFSPLKTRWADPWKHCRRHLVSTLIIVISTIACIGAILGILIVRLFLINWNSTYGSSAASLINAVVISCFNIYWRKVALSLTTWENYRLERDFRRTLVIRMFSFQFVNCYFSLFYIAFIKRYGVRYSDDIYDKCEPQECMDELSELIFSILLLNIVVGSAVEMWLPFQKKLLIKVVGCLKGLAKRKVGPEVEDENFEIDLSEVSRKKKAGQKLTPAEEKASEDKEADMEIVEQFERPPLKSVKHGLGATFYEYNELALQFGYIIMFSVVLPIGALFAVANNFLEVRLDALKVLESTRRVKPCLVDGIGAWRDVLEVLSYVGILTNLLILAFTSNFLDTFGIEATWERMGFVVIVEHLLLVLKLCIDWMNADIPSAVRKSLEREKWLAQMSFKAL